MGTQDSGSRCLGWLVIWVCHQNLHRSPRLLAGHEKLWSVIEPSCAHCGAANTPNPKTRKQRFCSSTCRWNNWADRNRDRLNANMRAYRGKRYEEDGFWRESGPKAIEQKAWMIELKSKPCTDCGNTFPTCCMDFDHRPGTVKTYNLGSMFAHHYSRELIETELDKCDLVCSNCHRVRTRDRRTGNRLAKKDNQK